MHANCGAESIRKLLEYSLDRNESLMSVKTLIAFAEDNKVTLRCYSAPYSKLHKLKKPFIIYTTSHFEYRTHVGKAETKDVVLVITAEKLKFRQVKSGLHKIKGSKGGGTIQVQQPSPPSAPSTGASIEEWIRLMPQIYETESKYGPLQAQNELSLLQDYGLQFGQTAKEQQEALYPETAGLQENLAQQAREGMESGVPDWMKDEYLSEFRSNLGSNAGSPIGADFTSRGLLQLNKGWKDYYRDLGLSVSGRQPLASPMAPQTGQYSQNFTPQDVMGFNANTYNTYAGAYSNMYSANAGLAGQQSTNRSNLLGQGIGAVGMLGYAGIMAA